MQNGIEIEFIRPVDHLCDFTYNFFWQHRGTKLDPKSTIPHQRATNYTYPSLIEELKKGGEVHIKGSVGGRLGYSLGVDLRQLGGTGKPIDNTGVICLEGDAGPEMGMGMVSGTIYITGNFQEPAGNILEVRSDQPGYRKLRSITDILSRGLGKDTLLLENTYEEKTRTLTLKDGIIRGTIGARNSVEATIIIEGDSGDGTGLLMSQGTVIVEGNAGMNTAVHLDGGLVAVKGNVGEFAGAYMKKGTLIILGQVKGYIGAGMAGGTIYAKKKAKPIAPVVELPLTTEDVRLLQKTLEIGHVEARFYTKYGIPKEKYVMVRMRDGSLVVRQE